MTVTEEPRPAECYGKCPPIVGGGYDCTCEGNPRCEKQWHEIPENDRPGRILGMFGEVVTVRLDTVTMTRKDGSAPPVKIPVIVVDIERPEGGGVTVTLDDDSSNDLVGALLRAGGGLPRDPATLTDDDLPTMSEAEKAAYYEANAHRLGEIFDDTKTVTFGPEFRPTYIATATREADLWVLDVEGIGAMRARSLRRAKSAVRDMISAALDIDKGSFHVVIDRHAVHEMDGVPTVCVRSGNGKIITFRDVEEEP